MDHDARNVWTYAQISLLWELAQSHASVSEISESVGKTYDEVYAKAADLGITFSFDRSWSAQQTDPQKGG